MPNPTPSPSFDARLTALLDSLGRVYYVVGRDYRLTAANTAAETHFRAKREDAIGRSIWDLFDGGRDSAFGRMLLRGMAGQPSWSTAESAVRPGRNIEVRVAPLGEMGVGVEIDDVTARRAAEKAVEESRQRLDLAVSAHAIGIFDWHIPSERTIWSREMETIFGLKPGTFGGHISDFRKLVVPEDLAGIQAKHAEALAAGRDLLTLEFRIVRADGAIRWIESAARFVFDSMGQAVRMVGTNIDVTERKAAEQRQELLINELNHRVKNTLAIVQAIAWQSFRGGGASRSAREAFEGRLAALAAAHDVVTRQSWEAGRIDQIIATATAPHNPADGRLIADGPVINLEPRSAVALGLAMHELATNAVKHGALSRPEGRVEIGWSIDDDLLRLTWRESGGPPVASPTPTRRGFGARLLEQGLANELNGTVTLDFRPEGLVCAVEARLER